MITFGLFCPDAELVLAFAVLKRLAALRALERIAPGLIIKIADKGPGGRTRRMADSFARLFRHSKWARLDLGLQRTVAPASMAPPSRPLYDGQAVTGVQAPRPRHYGLKHDLPQSIYGRMPMNMLVKELDGDFGQATVEHADHLAQSHSVLKELLEAQKAGRPVPCRVLNRTKRPDGYLVGIGGLVGRLSASEIPEGTRITFSDMAHRRAFWLWLKHWHLTDGKIYTNFTLYRPPSHDN